MVRKHFGTNVESNKYVKFEFVMMKMINKSLIVSALFLSQAVTSQTLQEAITKTQNENFAAAASDFAKLISAEPNKGENYFYYGENFFGNDEIEKANTQYLKGSEVNATYPLNYVGLGKVLLNKGKEADAKAMFYKANTLGANKNAEVMRKIAEAYLTSDFKNPDEAITQLNNAIKLDPKNPYNYILLGDAQLEKNPTDGSTPIKSYQKATELNPKSTRGILREGKLYQRGRNYQLALEYYNKAIGIDPSFAPAYREIAEVYMLAGQSAKAIESWKKYLEINNSNDARYRYFTALYNNKQYTEAIAEGESLMSAGYSNLYIPRILGYAYTELGNKTDTSAYTKGIKNLNKFFELAGSDFKFLYTDYKYKGLLLSKLGKDSLAVNEMEKAVALEPSKSNELTTEIARIYMKAKKYEKVITTYEKKMNGDQKNLTAADNFELGRAYYYDGGLKLKTKNETEAMQQFARADSCFSKLTQASSKFPAGYFWRGRANTQLDPKNDKWLAKPHFEAALNIVKPEEKTGSYKSNTIEALEYLGYYYVVSKDKEKADAYFNELKSLDPNNEKAKNYFSPTKGK